MFYEYQSTLKLDHRFLKVLNPFIQRSLIRISLSNRKDCSSLLVIVTKVFHYLTYSPPQDNVNFVD